MADLAQRLVAAQAVFAERVRAIRPEQWDDATPDREWTVADLVAHVISEHRWAPPLLAGLDLESSAEFVDRTPDVECDPLPIEVWDAAARGSAEAAAEDGALERKVNLVRGPTPAVEYVSELIFDLVVHTWDLCRAIGYDKFLPDEVVEPVWAEMKEFGDLSASGLFDLPVEIADDAPTIYRLVAMTGRDPSRSG